MNKGNYYPLLGLFIGIIAVSTASIFIKVAQAEAPSFVIAATRLFVATIVVTPIAIIQYKKRLIQFSKNEYILLILSGLFLAIHFASWITSLEYTSIASSVVLVTTTPLWVAIFSPIFIKEKIKANLWVGLILSLLGSSLVAISNQCSFSLSQLLICNSEVISLDKFSFLGNILALLGAWMAAGYIMVGRQVRTKIPLVIYIFYVYLFATIFLFIITLISGESFLGYSGKTYLWMVLLGLIPQLLGHSIFNWTLGHLPAAFVSIALIGEPIGTIILAFIFLNEIPSTLEFLGGLLILLGIFIVSYLNQKST